MKTKPKKKHGRRWQLQEAKNKFSEVVRRAMSEGPQTITLHGRDAVVIRKVQEDNSSSKRGRKGKVRSILDLLRPLRGADLQIPERKVEPPRVVFEAEDEVK